MSRVYGLARDRRPFALQEDADRVSTAYHEAGHVIGNVAIGKRPESLTVARDGAGEVATTTPATSRISARQAVVAHLCGWVAERMAGMGESITSERYEGDRRNAEAAMDAASIPEADQNAFLHDCTRDAVELVWSQWPAVDAIATRAVQKGTIGADEIARLYRSNQASCGQ
jgi:hypothetical protein